MLTRGYDSATGGFSLRGVSVVHPRGVPLSAPLVVPVDFAAKKRERKEKTLAHPSCQAPIEGTLIGLDC